MDGKKFEYGVVLQGTFSALIISTVLLPFYFPEYALYYLLLLLFFGFGLRPLIEKTGLYDLYRCIATTAREKQDRNFIASKIEMVERNKRDNKYRRARVKDSKLPKNW